MTYTKLNIKLCVSCSFLKDGNRGSYVVSNSLYFLGTSGEIIGEEPGETGNTCPTPEECLCSTPQDASSVLTTRKAVKLESVTNTPGAKGWSRFHD